MKNVCVIIGGGSRMGLAAAKFMPQDKIIVLSGRTVKKLESAVSELESLGSEAHAHACDTSDRKSLKELVFWIKRLYVVDHLDPSFPLLWERFIKLVT